MEDQLLNIIAVALKFKTPLATSFFIGKLAIFLDNSERFATHFNLLHFSN